MEVEHLQAILDDYKRAREAIRSLSGVQEMHLALIRLTRFNAFDGERIAADLEARRDLWDAVALAPDDQCDVDHMLLSLSRGHHGIDTLFILAATPKAAETLTHMAREEWGAEDSQAHRVPSDRSVVRLWWD